jgi:hypothetical protein
MAKLNCRLTARGYRVANCLMLTRNFVCNLKTRAGVRISFCVPTLRGINFLRSFHHLSFFFSPPPMALPAHSGPRPLIQFRNHISQTVGLLDRVISPSQGLYLNSGQHKRRINAYTHQSSMAWVGFEPTIPASERAKTVHALDRAATVTGYHLTLKGA